MGHWSVGLTPKTDPAIDALAGVGEAVWCMAASHDTVLHAVETAGPILRYATDPF